MKVVILTSPTGAIYIVAQEIVAIGSHIGGTVKTQVWVRNQEEPFNSCEDVETVRERIGWRINK